MFKKLAITTSLLLASASSVFAGGESWETNWPEAKTHAVEGKKDILLDFTGSDWCGWCIRLNKDGCSQDSFKAYASKNLGLVELDFPQKKKLPAELKAPNQKLAKQFGVRGYPTILLADAQGRPYAKTGYQAGGPENYVKHLEGLRQIRIQRDEFLDAANKTSGVAKAKLLVKAINVIDKEIHSSYKGIFEQIIKLDPKDETGYAKALKLKAQIEKLQQEFTGLLRQQKTVDALNKIQSFVKANELDAKTKQEVLLMQINCYRPDSIANLDKVDKILDEVIALDKGSKMGQRSKAIKKQIVGMRAGLAKKAK